jgi:hypothetical protein
MNHVRNLSYTDAPRYDYLRQLFQRVFKRERYNSLTGRSFTTSRDENDMISLVGLF